MDYCTMDLLFIDDINKQFGKIFLDSGQLGNLELFTELLLFCLLLAAPFINTSSFQEVGSILLYCK